MDIDDDVTKHSSHLEWIIFSESSVLYGYGCSFLL